jgi:DNA-binding transcriptional LysR family regulator
MQDLRRYHEPMRQLQLDDLALYTRIAALGSLSAVARERNVPVSQISRALTRLEQACTARLMHRSTHGLSLTDEGRAFLAYCKQAVQALEEIEGEFADRSGEPSGLVRVTASTVVAHYRLVPSLAGLAARHPRLSVELHIGDRMTDLAHEGIDIAIRSAGAATQLPDTVVARQIGTIGRKLYAAPAYVQAHGLPAHPDELAAHTLVGNSAIPMLNDWPFIIDGQPRTVTARGHWRANDTNIAAALVMQGLGIGRLATLVGDVLERQGLLVPVLEAYVDPQLVPVYAVTASARHRLPKIRACIAYWAEYFADQADPDADASKSG